MVNASKGMGVILVVCSHCGVIFYNYSIGDKSNKAKFSGVPTPSKALSGHDGLVCPGCNRRIELKPKRIQVMHWRKFVDLYDIVEKPLPRLRPRKHVVEEQIRTAHDLSRGIIQEQVTGSEGAGVAGDVNL
ncbi:MAG: hypothetical protein F7C38_07960 [Desulfurococcales archaeon]|nr:hypothetical protein [Desulfurococcales archaeon]